MIQRTRKRNNAIYTGSYQETKVKTLQKDFLGLLKYVGQRRGEIDGKNKSTGFVFRYRRFFAGI